MTSTPAGTIDGADIAIDDKRLIFVSAHVGHSVVTVARVVERRVQRMPAQACAFDPRRKFAHSRECGELAEVLRRRRILLGQELMHALIDLLHCCAILALDRFGHERCGGGGDRAALALEAQILDAVAVEAHRQRQTVAAQWVEALGLGIGRLQATEVSAAGGCDPGSRRDTAP